VSGRCPSCGCRALADPEPDDLPDDIALPPTPPPLTTTEFARRATARDRASVRGWAIYFLLTALFVAPLLTLLLTTTGFEAELWLAERLDDEDAAYHLTRYAPWVWFALAALVPVAVAAWSYRRVARRNPLECAHCQKAFILPRLVLASRRCDRCLEVAVSEPVGVEPSPSGG
jgi:hypothetical protein